jgi:hypothetical protein
VWGRRYTDPCFLDLGTSSREVSFTLLQLFPWRKSIPPGTTGQQDRWGPEAVWKNESSFHYRDSNSDLSVIQSVFSHYTDCDTSLEGLKKGAKGVQSRWNCNNVKTDQTNTWSIKRHYFLAIKMAMLITDVTNTS